MFGVKQNHKVRVTPIQVKPKAGDLRKSSNITHQLRWIIIAGACFGVNRLRVLKYSKIFMWLSYLYIVLIILISGLEVIFTNFTLCLRRITSYGVFRVTMYIEFIILMCVALLFNKKKLDNMFNNINTFDEKLNIIKDISITTTVYRGILWAMASIAYAVVESSFASHYFLSDSGVFSIISMYITLLAYEIEQIFYNTLLRTIMLRLIIIKAHVTKILSVNNDEVNKIEKCKVKKLAKNVRLDITSIHDAYVLLHKISEQLNSVMGTQMITIIFSAGLSTIMLLKIVVNILQTEDTNSVEIKSLIIFACIRCVKYTLQILIPCYFSSITTSLAYSIRTILHDALNTVKLDKVERRKIKAFMQMTHDNEFAYALWGVIRLNMSLPLSYLSLCITYLVIVIQFSKFID